jgi:hypothetical protein
VDLLKRARLFYWVYSQNPDKGIDLLNDWRLLSISALGLEKYAVNK